MCKHVLTCPTLNELVPKYAQLKSHNVKLPQSDISDGDGRGVNAFLGGRVAGAEK